MKLRGEKAVYIKGGDVKDASLDKANKMVMDNNVVLLSEDSLSYEYLHGWYDGAREIIKVLGKGDK